MITIENQHIGLNQTFKGKRIGDMTPAEILDMEKFLRTKMNIKHFVYDSNGSGEVFDSNGSNTIINGGISGGTFTPPKPNVKTQINIGGKTYNSWEELMNSGNVIASKTIDGSGNTITQKNNKVYVNGELICDNGLQPVIIVINGDVEDVTTMCGDVCVYGNVESAKSTSGDIKAENINCDAKSVSGDIRAKSISGHCSTVSGIIYNKLPTAGATNQRARQNNQKL